ncbi:MAG: hypothetical protein ABFS24_01485 [Pseudomonadota bacterium]
MTDESRVMAGGLLVVLSVLVVVIVLAGSLIGSSVQEFTSTFPVYEARLKEISSEFVNWRPKGRLVPMRTEVGACLLKAIRKAYHVGLYSGE